MTNSQWCIGKLESTKMMYVQKQVVKRDK